MKRGYLSAVIAGSLSLVLAGEAAATEWDVSLWGKRRAFTEHVEKLAELVSTKTKGEFKLNLSYGGLSKNRENLDGISIGAFEIAQFCAGYHYDKNPSITVLELPFLGVSSLEQEVKVSRAVYRPSRGRRGHGPVERHSPDAVAPCRNTTLPGSARRLPDAEGL